MNTAANAFDLDTNRTRGAIALVTDHTEPAFWVYTEGLDEEVEDRSPDAFAAWCSDWCVPEDEQPDYTEAIVNVAIECAQGTAEACGLPSAPHDPYDGDFANGLHEVTGDEPTDDELATFETAYRAEQERLIDLALDGDQTFGWADQAWRCESHGCGQPCTPGTTTCAACNAR